MHFKTTSYPLDCPEPVWDALVEVQATDRNINDEIVYAIALRVEAANVSLPPAQREAVEAIVGEDTDEPHY